MRTDVNRMLLAAVNYKDFAKMKELINIHGLIGPQSWGRSGGYFLLLRALKIGDLDIIMLLLNSGCSIVDLSDTNWYNKQDTPSESPLHIVVNNQNIADKEKIPVLDMLLRKGATMYGVDSNGFTPFHLAASKRNLLVCQCLLAHGAFIDSVTVTTSQYQGSRTALSIAVENETLDVVKLLLKHKANINFHQSDGTTPLQIAVKKGNLQILKYMLTNGEFLDFPSENESGSSALIYAVEIENFDVVKLLIGYNTDINFKERDGFTSLHIAVQKGNIKITEYLLQQGAVVNSTTFSDGDTTLFAAIKQTYIDHDIVKLLIDHGALVDAKDKQGRTALLLAVECKRHQNIVRYILNGNPDKNDPSNINAFYCALVNGSKETVSLLWKYGFNVLPKDKNNENILYGAIEKGFAKIVKTILKYGIDVNYCRIYENKYGLPLHVATEFKQWDIMKLLLEYGADSELKDRKNNNAIFYAIKNKDARSVELLINVDWVKSRCKRVTNSMKTWELIVNTIVLEPISSECDNFLADVAKVFLKTGVSATTLARVSHRANECWVDNDIFTLQLAAFKGYTNLFDVFLQHNVDLTILSSKYQSTLLHFATQGGNYNICKNLLKKQIDVNAKDNHGMTSLLHLTTFHYPDFTKYIRTIEVLLDNGARIDSTNLEGETAIHSAAMRGYSAAMMVLLSHCSKSKIRRIIDVKANNGETALFSAIATDDMDIKIVQALINHGADVNQKFLNHSSPLQLACEYERKDIVLALLKFGAEINVIDVRKYISNRRVSFEYSDDEYENYYHVSDEEFEHWNVHLEYFDLEDTDCSDSEEDTEELNDLKKDKYYNLRVNKLHEILLLHIIKLKSAGLYVELQNALSCIEELPLFKRVVATEKCLEEVEKLKVEMIGDSSVSFFSFLHKSPQKTAMFLRNNRVLQKFNWIAFYKKFPIYADLIDSKFKKGIVRLELFENHFGNLCNIFANLSHDCVQHVMEYIPNNDLIVLADFFDRLALVRFAQLNFRKVLVRLPKNCLDKIINYFSNEDLRVLKEAFSKITP